MGAKRVYNQTSSTLGVTFLVRSGDDPNTPTVEQVSASIPAGGSEHVDYGSQPFLNGLEMRIDSPSDSAQSTLVVNQRGGGGTLDAQLNTNNTLSIGYDSGTRAFSLSASNS